MADRQATWWQRLARGFLRLLRGYAPLAEPAARLAPVRCENCGNLFTPRPPFSPYQHLPVCRQCNGERPLSERMYLAELEARQREAARRKRAPAPPAKVVSLKGRTRG